MVETRHPVSVISEREKAIGARLRQFREDRQIPRAKFAVAIGFGSERIASIEAGRAPLRFEVFRAVAERYQINPAWLATGKGLPSLPADVYSALFFGIPQRLLFSSFYDNHFAVRFPPGSSSEVMLFWDEVFRFLDRGKAAIETDTEGKLSESFLDNYRNLVTKLKTFFEAEHSKRKVLTHFGNALNSPTMKRGSLWIALRERLKAVLTQFGAKSALAREFNVTPASVSEWLSGDSMPTAETTLRLLEWVQVEEAKQESPGSVVAPPEPKAQSAQSKHEKSKSGRKKR